MIDLCILFGVDEGEEFRVGERTARYKISDNSLWVYDDYYKGWKLSDLGINTFTDIDIIKLPKRKQFTDDELAIMRSLPKEYKWIARDEYGSDDEIYTFSRKPKKEHAIWENNGSIMGLRMFKHLFQSIQWEDEEPLFIDDYVER